MSIYFPNSLTINNLKDFLESKTGDKYTIIRKIVFLDLYDNTSDEMKKKYYNELEALKIKRKELTK